jgi:transcriptional regulator with XRE-family HTH domain
MEKFGKNLRVRARQLGLTDAAVARMVGISARRYGFYVTGDRDPDLSTLVKIADALQAPVDDLLRGGERASLSSSDALKAKIVGIASSLTEPGLELLADIAAVVARQPGTRLPPSLEKSSVEKPRTDNRRKQHLEPPADAGRNVRRPD